MDLKENSGTLSEGSETTTVNSDGNSGMFSKQDLRESTTRIGLENINGPYQQRFRVERQKLEDMLIGDKQALNPGATFFHKIMQDTNTVINWPSISNIRATKKDPRVTLSGRQQDVRKAKYMIENVLTNKYYHVTIRMDVSYTDHSYIIGKKGAKTNWVKQQTGCYIHFPRLLMYKISSRSNQVDIIGDVVGAEQARSRVRNMSPLIFRFELPKNSNTPYMNQIEKLYNVEVLLEVETKHHKMFMTVKGSEREAIRVKQATYLLRELLHGDRSDQIPIQMCIEISSHYHEDVTGKKHEKLNSIMENTQTQISFPDVLTDSKVVISGNIDNVCLAKQQLTGSLPLLVIFHLPKECQSKLTPEKFETIQSELDVTITIRPRTKRNCVIKGIERHSSNIYEARNRVLGFDEPRIVADIPPTYFTPLVGGTTKVTLAASGYSPLGEASSSIGSLKRRQEERCSSVPSTSSMYISVKSPMATPSSSYQSNRFKHSTVFGIQEMQNKRDEEYEVQTRERSGYGVSYVNFDGLLLSDQEKIWRHKEDQPSKNLTYNQSKSCEDQQSFTTRHFDDKRIAEIRAMQDRHAQAYRISTSNGSGYGVNYTSVVAPQLYDQKEKIGNQEGEQVSKYLIYCYSKDNENQQSFTTPNFDKKHVEEIREMQNMHESKCPLSSSSGSGYKVDNTILGILELSD